MNASPDPRILATARLLENLAAIAPQFRAHIAEQYALIDSYPQQVAGANPTPKVSPTRPVAGICVASVPAGDDPDTLIDCGRARPCPDHDTPITLTATERAAAERERLRNKLDNWQDQLTLIDGIASRALTVAHQVIGTRANLGPQQECRDGIHGKDLTPKLTGEIATCTRLAEKVGLCARHYTAWYRERRRPRPDA